MDPTQVSCIAGRFFTIWATREANIYLDGVIYSFIQWILSAYHVLVTMLSVEHKMVINIDLALF